MILEIMGGLKNYRLGNTLNVTIGPTVFLKCLHDVFQCQAYLVVLLSVESSL